MTIKQLAKLLCDREGLKKQVSIADMYEVLIHLTDLTYEDPEVIEFLRKYGERRHKRKQG
jgi:hypothetical protein